MKIPTVFYRPWALRWTLLVFALPGHAAPITISAWNLRPSASQPPRKVVESLQQSHPDVIILQHVADWNSCQQLARKLEPEIYEVAVCSSFPKAANFDGEVAILSRIKPFLAWSEKGKDGGGFAFAALRLAGRNVGIFSIEPGRTGVLPLEFTRQMDSLPNWKDNQLRAFVVAGDFDFARTQSHLKEIGFDAAPLPLGDHSEFVFTRQGGLVTVAPLFQTVEGSGVACEMEMDVPPAPPAIPPSPAKPAPNPPLDRLPIFACMAAALGIVVAFLILRRKRASAPNSSLAPMAAVPEIMRAGVAANLTRWLKQKFVQRLMADRAQLMAAQQVAALKVLAVDERLTKIEHQIQQRHREYEQRIDDLVSELAAAKEENRELIRSKIALVKIEMEKARLRAEEQSQPRY